MKNDVFITGTSCYFPNKPVSNEDMEEFLGLIAENIQELSLSS